MRFGTTFCFLFFTFIFCCCLDISEKVLPVLNKTRHIGSEKGALHVVTTTECSQGYFAFQSLALKRTFDKVYQNVRLTRIVSCDQERALFEEEDLELMDTIIVPNWSIHPVTHDAYSPYNRPVGLIYWLAEREPTAEWTLIVDPDMQFRQPFQIDAMAVPPGIAMSSGYSYLIGVNNELADRHIGYVDRRDDTFGGPKGRRADQAGSFFMIRTKDLLEVAPLWLKYTENVRNDPHAWNLTGDQYVKPGGRAWISEMYGYAFAAATSGIWHHIDSTIQYYPGYRPKDIPLLTHYGLNMHLGNYSFDKHDHLTFQSFACPPWKLDPDRKREEDKGLFPHPPSPEEVTTVDPRIRYGQLMIIETVNVINQALCDRHRRKCPISDQLTKECEKVDSIARSLDDEFDKLHTSHRLCYDEDERCPFWAKKGECLRNWSYMDNYCRASCHRCRTFIALDRIQKSQESNHDIQERDMMDDMSSKSEVEFIRCSKLSDTDLIDDIECQKLINDGYAEVEDFSAKRSLEIPSNPSNLLTINFIRPIVILLAFIFLILAVGRRHYWRKAKPHKIS